MSFAAAVGWAWKLSIKPVQFQGQVDSIQETVSRITPIVDEDHTRLAVLEAILNNIETSTHRIERGVNKLNHQEDN
jgi:hypothetical protein